MVTSKDCLLRGILCPFPWDLQVCSTVFHDLMHPLFSMDSQVWRLPGQPLQQCQHLPEAKNKMEFKYTEKKSKRSRDNKSNAVHMCLIVRGRSWNIARILLSLLCHLHLIQYFWIYWIFQLSISSLCIWLRSF